MNAVITIAIGQPYEAYAKISHPSIAAYAKRIGADFVVIDKQLVSTTSPHYEKFQISAMLAKYNRIIYIDTDAIVRDDCPNLFDIVPESCFGAFDEGAIMDRKEAMKKCCSDYSDPKAFKDWNNKYYNTGVMVISRRHRDLFLKPEKELWNYYEQSYINLKIIQTRTKTFDLDYRFNRMCALDKLTGEHRLKSYIVHYAGVLEDVQRIMPIDLSKWASGEYKAWRRKIIINVGANRLGDNICAEPLARYVVENVDADVSIVALFPEAFTHLQDKAKVLKMDDFEPDPNFPHLLLNTSPAEDDPITKFMAGHHMNAIDYISIASIKRVLPEKYRSIRLPITAAGLAEAMEVAGCPLHDMVLVHPGRTWASKTFPKGYWESIVRGLVDAGMKVGVVGADMPLERGFVDIDMPESVVDFRNLLSLNGLFSLLSVAKVFVTNDAGPYHAATAFDNWIVLIPTCKHPDLLIANRPKTIPMYKKIMAEPWRPGPGEPELEKFNGKIEDYLPCPESVVDQVAKITETSGCPKKPTYPMSSEPIVAQ